MPAATLPFKRDMPGVYLAPGWRISRNCDCHHCPPWVVVRFDPEDDVFEIDRHEGIATLAEAKRFANWLRENHPV